MNHISFAQKTPKTLKHLTAMKQVTIIIIATFVVALIVAAGAAVAATIDPKSVDDSKLLRGVMDQYLAKYKASMDKGKSVFTCFDGKKTIPLKNVNDDFCDCADGSDEPGSSACSYQRSANPNVRFQCTNDQHSPRVIQAFFHSRVNDGICDCCDGSDEYLYPGINCPDNCAGFAKAQAEEDARREQIRQAGLAAKTAMMHSAEEVLAKWKTELAQLESSVVHLEAELPTLEAEVAAKESEELKRRAEIHAESLAKKALWEREQVEKKDKAELEANGEKINKMHQQAESVQGGGAHEEHAAVERSMIQEESALLASAAAVTEGGIINNAIKCVGWRQTKNCDGTDEGREPESDRPCEFVIDSGQSGYCECNVDGADETYPFNCGHRKLRCANVCRLRGSDDAFEPDDSVPPPVAPAADAESFTVDTGSGFYLPEANDARTKRDEQKRQVDTAKSSIKTLKEKMDKDYGPGGVFRGFGDQCFEKSGGEFVYKLCPMQSATQGHTSLGTFKQYASQTYGSWGGKSDYAKHEYEQGTYCHGGSSRRTDVILVCGAENIIKSVDEPSMCVYKMVFQTPAICE